MLGSCYPGCSNKKGEHWKACQECLWYWCNVYYNSLSLCFSNTYLLKRSLLEETVYSWHFQLLIRHPLLLESNLLIKLVLKFPATFPWFWMKGRKEFIEVFISQASTQVTFVSSCELEAGIQRCLNLGLVQGPQAD